MINLTVAELVDGLNDCDNATYHADRKYLSSSVLKTVLESLEKYHKEYILGLKEPYSQSTQSNFDVGSLIHSMILEPHLVETSYNWFMGMRKAGLEYETFMASRANSTLPSISINQRLTAQNCYEAYKALPAAVNLIQNGFAEQTICGTLHGVPIKTRFDWINVEKGYIADVKSTSYGSDLETFKATCDSFKYQLSGALYTAMAEQFYGKKFDFYYIVVSKKDKTCNVYKTSAATMAKGKAKVKEACEKYLQAKSTNIWTDSENSDKIVLSDTNYKIEEI